MSVPETPAEALRWLAERGAHPWLVRHHELVLEAAEELVAAIARELGVRVDERQVLLGAALHDAGKIVVPEEMRQRGHAHERAGERMLLDAGFEPRVARACVTHATWWDARASIEDRLIALADALWKGRRDDALERALLEEIARMTGREAWEVFDAFDRICERVADGSEHRLARSEPA